MNFTGDMKLIEKKDFIQGRVLASYIAHGILEAAGRGVPPLICNLLSEF